MKKIVILVLTLITSRSYDTKGQEKPDLIAFVPRTYFYSEPDYRTKLKAYLVPPNRVRTIKESNGFIYVEYKNNTGHITKGWLSRLDLFFPDNTYIIGNDVCEEYEGMLNNKSIKLVTETTQSNVYHGYSIQEGKRTTWTGAFDKQTNQLKLYSEKLEMMICTKENSNNLKVVYYPSNKVDFKNIVLTCTE